jgi:hypothetical protein
VARVWSTAFQWPRAAFAEFTIESGLCQIDFKHPALHFETCCMLSVNLFPIFFMLALFPVAFFWLRRAYRIGVKRDFSEVALKKGLPPADPEKYAPYELMINLLGGFVIVSVIVIVLLGLMDYQSWVALAGSTLWIKLFASFALSRQAHGLGPKNK